MTLLLLAACTSTTDDTVAKRCTVSAIPSTTEVRPGDTVSLTGGPYTDVNDSRILVADTDVSASEVTRSDCTVCDACRADGGCTADCSASCASCVEVTTFVFPAAEPGPTTAVLVNDWGASDPIALTVAPSDTDR